MVLKIIKDIIRKAIFREKGFILKKAKYERLLIFSFFIIGVVIINIWSDRMNSRGYELIKNYEFNGKIEKIIFDSRKKPSLILNGEKYYLITFTKEFDEYIQVGDSIVKTKDDFTITVFRKNGNILEKSKFK